MTNLLCSGIQHVQLRAEKSCSCSQNKHLMTLPGQVVGRLLSPYTQIQGVGKEVPNKWWYIFKHILYMSEP